MLRRSGVGFEEREVDVMLPRLFGRRRVQADPPVLTVDPVEGAED